MSENNTQKMAEIAASIRESAKQSNQDDAQEAALWSRSIQFFEQMNDTLVQNTKMCSSKR